MDPVGAATLVIAVAGLGLGVVNSYAAWQGYRRDRADVKVVAIFTPGFAPAAADGGPPPNEAYAGRGVSGVMGRRVLVTATNVGRQPVAVTAMFLEAEDRESYWPMDHVSGGGKGGVLQVGEYRTWWEDGDKVAEWLRERGGRKLRRVGVTGPSGARWFAPDLGGIDKLDPASSR
jgi:hypothetical protein